MACRAAVGDVAPAAHHVKPFFQCALAARAIQIVGQGLVGRCALLMQQAKQLGNRSGRQLQVLLWVKPHALTLEAEVEFDGLAMVAGQCMHVHGGAA